MRFLVDESTGKRLANLLAKTHDVVFVGDEFAGATDEEILEMAQKQKRILITDDKDFGELVFRLERPSFGVILFRTSSSVPEARLELLKKVFARAKLRGKFVVVTETEIRIRKLS